MPGKSKRREVCIASGCIVCYVLFHCIILFIYLFIVWLTPDAHTWISTHPGWFLLHGTNIFNFLSGYCPVLAQHLWSLSVEEQIYLLWPFLLILLSERWIISLCCSLVIVSLGSRYYLLYGIVELGKPHAPFISTLTHLNADAFGLGTLLTIVYRRGRIDKFASPYFILSLLAFGLGICALIPFDYFVGLFPLLQALFGCWLIVFSLRSAFIAKLLSCKFLVYPGKISYGIYIWHPIIFVFFFNLLKKPQLSEFISNLGVVGMLMFYIL